jgi:predicted nucleic acid-binding protein
MRFLLDTDVISDSIKPKPSVRASEWRNKYNDEDFYISVITFGEIEYGIARKAPGQGKRRLEQFFTELTAAFSGRALPVDAAVASTWGLLRAQAESQGRPMPMADGLLAATAKYYGLTLATGNTKDFSAAGISLVNPFVD